ncbi:MAG: aminotransferase class I/II-fold pyridoxal phosphate-dependent enzyme [Armatimonadetes bacterium]|nr:aminotransferase class I/II-fold pyridoxal phosphate-dependent enzyme [Armatimonadota bacterium]
MRYVLCIDDDREVLDTLARDLSWLGPEHRLECCQNAAEADDLLTEIEAQGDALALVICDQVMPGESGVQFLERLHARAPTARKVLLTAYAGLASAVHGINRSGLSRYLEKPWQPESLRHTLTELLEDYACQHAGDPALDQFARRDGPDLYAKVEAFSSHFAELRREGFYFWQRPLASGCEHVVRMPDGRSLLMLSSNNYLGLTTHPRVLEAARQALERFGSGTGAVPLLSGTLELHGQLEQRLAALKGGQACCLFPTGYSANVGILSALARDTDVIFLDRLVHASIVDGARACGARIRTFHHNRPDDLERKLTAESRRSPRCGRLVVVDAVYSMDGDIAPLPELLQVAHGHGARVMVDEAHSTGVLGERGRGIAEHFGLKEPIDLVMGTLSKALGSLGGFCVAPFPVVDYLRHYARSHIFSTSLPPATTAASVAALDVLEAEPERVANLRARSQRVRARLQAAGLDTGPSQTAIIPIIVGDQTRLARMGKDLYARGLYLNSVYYPAVPREQCRLRLSLMATHTEEELDAACDTIVEIAHRHGLL